ncbi:ribosome hibernation-promoting factor, HPF/YfiA family [Allosphingosinicella deserti]|uniref:Ribosome hibernation promoting factor n=1 Tax=Allosphingosinicella deserti TaxID=2116704 RepID=A0A2P7QUG3_9SPHN|nr:ribosome-associated translation inhibitor RaiA [Sphingomonas deserti]PSJ41580.1 ribosome-associated translation inhibitor RaiA [Sphingomonas deserti]
MDIRVSGHQVDTGEALRSRVEDRLNAIADKYFSRAISAQVTFGKGPHDHGFTCEIVSYVPAGVVLKASDRAADAHAAFDAAADKVEKQLRRYTRRLKDRQAPSPAQALEDLSNAEYRVFSAADGQDDEDVGEHPLIVAETRVDIPDASVSDAVMMLDLRNTNALMFRNSGTGSFNMVYRREDGTIGWVEPKAQ